MSDDFNYGQVTHIAAQADTCLAFANAYSGEGYIGISGNAYALRIHPCACVHNDTLQR
jgi:hypothetical protein